MPGQGLGMLGVLDSPALQPAWVSPAGAIVSSSLRAQAPAGMLRAGTRVHECERGGTPGSQQGRLSTEGFIPRGISHFKLSFPRPQTLPLVLLGRVCREIWKAAGGMIYLPECGGTRPCLGGFGNSWTGNHSTGGSRGNSGRGAELSGGNCRAETAIPFPEM